MLINDGLSDDWEREYGLEIAHSDASSVDSDNDSVSNHSEYQNGANPNDSKRAEWDAWNWKYR